MIVGNSLDQQPDPELGEALRRHLDPGGHEEFVRHLRGLLSARIPESPWEVLARWLRPGVAAAAFLAIIIGAWAWTHRRAAPQPDLSLRQAGPGELLFTNTQSASHDEVLGVVVGRGR